MPVPGDTATAVNLGLLCSPQHPPRPPCFREAISGAHSTATHGHFSSCPLSGVVLLAPGDLLSLPPTLSPQLGTGASCTPAVTQTHRETQCAWPQPGGAATTTQVCSQPSPTGGDLTTRPPGTAVSQSLGWLLPGTAPHGNIIHSLAPTMCLCHVLHVEGEISVCFMEPFASGLVSKVRACAQHRVLNALLESPWSRSPDPWGSATTQRSQTSDKTVPPC